MPVDTVLHGNDLDAIGQGWDGIAMSIWGDCMDQRGCDLHEGHGGQYIKDHGECGLTITMIMGHSILGT